VTDDAGGRVARHPLNRDFTWQNHAGLFRLITDEQARAYDDDGYFVLENAIDPDTLAEVVEAIDPFEAQTEAFLRGLDRGQLFIARAGEITFTTHLVTRSERLRSFVSGPPFGDLCADLLGRDVRLYWDQAVYKKPGTESHFPWHQDNGYGFVEPQQYLTCWIALTDATHDNGRPWDVPGLHRLGTLAHESTDLGLVCLADAPDAVAVPARAGSMVVFSSLTPHSTGPNRTDAPRKSYIVQFAPDGAEILGADGDATTRTPAADPDRQFPILADGAAPA
jgi:ectoine hydroxylase-related dioxygenase (phytanoyl-CoA dioxygenase family)